MTMTVKCGICGEILAEVTKPSISSQDETVYQQSCSCDQDGQTNIETVVEE